MRQTTQNTMQAVAIDRFGGLETLTLQVLPVPKVGPDQVLLRVESAGVGKWDIFEREGMFAEMYGSEPSFPYVLGSEGAGTVAAVGESISRFQEGDQVYGLITTRAPKGGFYAEYAAVDAKQVWPIPGNLTIVQAGAMPIGAGTVLRGLRDTLGLKQGEALMIFGASGGVGHMAVQLAKRMGARVLAVASGDDGVELAQRLCADAVVEGHTGDVVAAARVFAPDGLDAALVTAGGEATERALAAVRNGGCVAYPNGVQPEPKAQPGVHVKGYNAMYGPELMNNLNRLIDAGQFEVHVARTFSLNQAAEAHRALDTHFLGRLALRPS
jgi:NADPH2:quinone reductase